MKHAICLMMLLVAPAAGADEVRQVEVSGPRITLGEVLPGAAPALRGIDLGPAPAPGSSRIVTRDEIERALPSGKGRPLEGVRVLRKMVRLGAAELDRLARASLVAALPPGVTLTAIHPPAVTVVAAGFTSVHVTWPKLPHHPGPVSLTSMVDLARDGEVIQSIASPIELALDAASARPDISRGASITIVIRHGMVEVSAPAIAAADGDIGDVMAVTVRTTGRSMRARVETKERLVALDAAPLEAR